MFWSSRKLWLEHRIRSGLVEGQFSLWVLLSERNFDNIISIQVTETKEWYLKEVEHREEGGTADAVGAVRLAMAVKMKRSVGEERIKSLERDISNHAVQAFKNIKNLVLLGAPTTENRIPVFSFLIRDSTSQLFFHHNYISVLLNDLFGIQTRAGCMCAGPYAQKLLGMNEQVGWKLIGVIAIHYCFQLAERYAEAIRESGELDRTHLRRQAEYSEQEFLRPGFTRISFPYYFTKEQIGDIISAIRFVADHAADFLHLVF